MCTWDWDASSLVLGISDFEIQVRFRPEVISTQPEPNPQIQAYQKLGKLRFVCELCALGPSFIVKMGKVKENKMK